MQSYIDRVCGSAGSIGDNTDGLITSNTYNTTGSLTKASVTPMTPTDFKNLFYDSTDKQWNEMSAFFKTQFEMKACGTRRYGFYDWLISSNKPGLGKMINTTKMDRGPALIHPFIMGRQTGVVNMDYWAITNGWAASGYTSESTGPLTTANKGSGRVIRVVSRYGVELDPAYFNERHRIIVLNTASGAAAVTQFKVTASALATDGSYVDVAITAENPTVGDNATPTNGIVLVGINNVADVESYVANNVNYNSIHHVPFWYQTYRWTRQVDDLYVETFKRLMADNAYFAEFYDLPIAERNRQDELMRQKQFVNSFLFGQAISSNQTLSNWAALDNITTITANSQMDALKSKMIAKRANMIGVHPMLRSCGRVKDLQGQTLNMVELQNWLYEMYRSRETQGRPTNNGIDLYTNRHMAETLEAGFINLAKAKYGDIIRVNIEAGGGFGFHWNKFSPSWLPFQINVITNEVFDDLYSAFAYEATATSDSSLATRGNFIAALDIGKGGTIYPAILGSNRKVWKTGDISKMAAVDPTFATVMENPTVETTLTSETVTAIVECPKNSGWIEGISLAVSTATAANLTGDVYGTDLK